MLTKGRMKLSPFQVLSKIRLKYIENVVKKKKKRMKWLVDGQIVVVVENDRLQERVVLHAQLVELVVLVDDAVLGQRLVHVEHTTLVLPRVGAGVCVILEIAAQNLVHVLLRANLFFRCFY